MDLGAWLSCKWQDAEKEKLRSALGSAIMVDTPNVKVRGGAVSHPQALDQQSFAAP